MRTDRQLIDAPSTGTIYFDLRCSKSGYPFFTFLLLTSLFNLFLGTSVFGQSPGTVQSFQKISSSAGNFTGVLSNDDVFGHGLANIGDLN